VARASKLDVETTAELRRLRELESFFHSMKADVFHGCKFDDDEQVRALLKGYLPFYNGARLHSSLNYVPPATFEQQARRTGCQ
jgi:hypothetical protein